MSTYADITLNNKQFHVTHDGSDIETIREVVQEAIDFVKDKVTNKEDIAGFVIAKLRVDAAEDYYNFLQNDNCGCAEFGYEGNIDYEGKLHLEKIERVNSYG
jgi:hypothetical protein